MVAENSPLDTLLNVFQGQWLMWMNARDAQNTRMMRMTLAQAVSSQDLIIEMGGQREMANICDNWDAREELRRMDDLPHPSTNPQDQRLAITNYHHQSLAPPSNHVGINNYRYSQSTQAHPPLAIENFQHKNTPVPMEGLEQPRGQQPQAHLQPLEPFSKTAVRGIDGHGNLPLETVLNVFQEKWLVRMKA